METLEKNKYQWQGQLVSVRFGYVFQHENSEKPLYWYNFECYNNQQLDGSFKPNHFTGDDGKLFALIPAVEVKASNGYTFLLANHFGIGVNKLLKGGWPNSAHFSLDGDFTENHEPYFKFTDFDLEGYEKWESNRYKWQKKTYPEEFKIMESLREAMMFNTLSK